MHISEHSKIRDYTILNKVGEGGMGEVYLAEDENLGRKVAIKALAPELLRNKELIERFKKEARLQATLIHPNIVAIHSFFSEDGNYYMVQEYAEGTTIKEIIKSSGRINEQRSKKILLQVLEGLGYAHSLGIIHRDIKPSNIMVNVNSDDKVKIMDFGIAKVLGDKGMTRTGTKMGTIYYMSPEQVRAEKDIDQRTDIYSLGIVLYEMLTGELPFNRNTDSDFEVMSEIVNGKVNDPRKVNDRIGEQIVKVLQKMISKQKENRFTTCYQCEKEFMNGEDKWEGQQISVKDQPTIELSKSNNDTPISRLPFEPEMIFVEGSNEHGKNNMSSSGKNLRINISSFYIGKFPVTQREWKEIMGINPSNFKGDNLPVEKVSWFDIQEYLGKQNEKSGKNYRLPTEAEWEFAVLGGNKSNRYLYGGSNIIEDVAWYSSNSNNKTHPVGTKKPNELGIYDLSGNVWEWCNDWYNKNNYSNKHEKDPRGPKVGKYKVLRGGSWYNPDNYCTCMFRSRFYPGERNYCVGFRCALGK